MAHHLLQGLHWEAILTTLLYPQDHRDALTTSVVVNLGGPGSTPRTETRSSTVRLPVFPSAQLGAESTTTSAVQDLI